MSKDELRGLVGPAEKTLLETMDELDHEVAGDDRTPLQDLAREALAEAREERLSKLTEPIKAHLIDHDTKTRDRIRHEALVDATDEITVACKEWETSGSYLYFAGQLKERIRAIAKKEVDDD